LKTKINISLTTLIILLISSLILGVIISISGLMVASVKAAGKDYISAIIGSLGNVIGGVIGVIGAVLIGTYQIQKTFELENYKGAASNSAVLRLIKTELESNKRILTNFKQDYLSGKLGPFLDSVSLDNWERCSLHIGIEVSDNTLQNINSVYNKLRLLKSGPRLDEATFERILTDLETSLQSISVDLQNLS
jgi:hypothetical protein